MTPTSGANARVANVAEAVPARRPLSRPWKPPPRASRRLGAAAHPPRKKKPVRVKFSRVANFRRVSIKGWAVRHLRPAGPVYSDGLNAFRGIADAGCCHRPIVTGSGKKAVRTPAFKWANTLLGNLKTSLAGTFHAIRDKHVPRYLAQFQYRFNRRYDLAAMIPRLGWAAPAHALSAPQNG